MLLCYKIGLQPSTAKQIKAVHNANVRQSMRQCPGLSRTWFRAAKCVCVASIHTSVHSIMHVILLSQHSSATRVFCPPGLEVNGPEAVAE